MYVPPRLEQPPVTFHRPVGRPFPDMSSSNLVCAAGKLHTSILTCLLNCHLSLIHRPIGLTLFGICWQGGGVLNWGGTVTFTSCSIYSNQAASVSACFLNLPGHFFHRPVGLTPVLVSRHVAVVTLGGQPGVSARAVNLPGHFFHRPNGRTFPDMSVSTLACAVGK